MDTPDLNIGGVTLCDVINFQTRILFGAQYGRIEYAKNNNKPDELILACLRVGGIYVHFADTGYYQRSEIP